MEMRVANGRLASAPLVEFSMSTLLREESYTGNNVTRKQKTTPQILGTHQSLQIRGGPWMQSSGNLWNSSLGFWLLGGAHLGTPHTRGHSGVSLALVTPLSEEEVENCSLRCFAKKMYNGEGSEARGHPPTSLLSPPLAW